MHYRSIIEEVKRKIEELHVFIRIYDPRQVISLNQLEPGTISVMRCKDGFRGVLDQLYLLTLPISLNHLRSEKQINLKTVGTIYTGTISHYFELLARFQAMFRVHMRCRPELAGQVCFCQIQNATSVRDHDGGSYPSSRRHMCSKRTMQSKESNLGRSQHDSLIKS